LGFVIDKARKGDYGLNPFDFRRSWDIEVDEASVGSSKEELLERELQRLKDQFELFQEKIRACEESTKGGPSKNQQRHSQSSFLGRLRSSFAEQSVTSDADSDISETAPPPYREREGSLPRAKKIKTVFIKKVELLLNGTPLDQGSCHKTF